MAVIRERGKVVFVCDECGDATLDTVERDWDDALQVMRGEGWKATKKDGWEHYCPSCWEGK